MFSAHHIFCLAKDADKPASCQDATAVDNSRGIAAVADGVSSSLFSGHWARLLAEGIVADPPNINEADSWQPWLAEKRQAWSESIDPDTLAWHQKSKLHGGAFSTLLWVRINASRPPGADEASAEFSMHGFAIGDCCLFHVRDDQVLRAFPIEDSRLFDDEPKAIGSTHRPGESAPEFHTLENRCRNGDLLVLCTDAVAAWALGRLETGSSPGWESHWGLATEDWVNAILKYRQRNEIRHDDTTVLLLRIGQPCSTDPFQDRIARWIGNMPRRLLARPDQKANR